ncbi:MAG: Sec-independent protein translocase protein TatB [Methylophilaceae bacterium]|nr:Sec-independent protein translocase protein TatB [Methylophilaceae bacterium]
MFDIAFTELVLIAIVALVVIGPEKLPKVARTVGSLLGRMQRYVATVKQDVERELQMAELKKMQQDIEQNARTLQSGVENSIHAGLSELKQPFNESSAAVSEPPPAIRSKSPSDSDKTP